MGKKNVTRRGFMQTAAVAGAASGSFGALPAKVLGANERVRIGVIGPGGRAAGWKRPGMLEGHMRHLCRFGKDWAAEITAVCDVWDYRTDRAQALAKKEGGFHAKAYHRDYRRLLDDKNVDAVLIATPDHWHAKQTIDAAEAGKDVYCEKPMTHTIEEARRVCEAIRRNHRVMQVGVQSMSDPRWRMAHRLICEGRIGHIMQAQTSYYRNSNVGQWRYYQLTKNMSPQSIDWKMFLGTEFGLAPDRPFDRAVYQQWRCYWDFGGGMYTDLFVHQLTHLISAIGVRFPARVVGAGGLYLEYDQRDVPDVATVVADYKEGCQVIVTATMCNDHPIEEVIRGHTGTIHFTGDGFDILPQKVSDQPGKPSADVASTKEHVRAKSGSADETPQHWQNFLECVRSRNYETNNTPELGYAAIVTVNLGTRSYREGKAFFWDAQKHQLALADASWAAGWEHRSEARGKPNQVAGWHAGNKGSVLFPPEYMKLAGPWVGDRDPATGGGGG